MARYWRSPWRLPGTIALVVTAITIALFFMYRSGSENSPPQPKSEQTYRVGYQETAIYRHVFTAKDRGFFTREGVNVQLIPFPSANQMMLALLAGQIDVAGLTNLEVALKVESEEANRFEMVNFLVWTRDAYPDYVLDCTVGHRLQNLGQLNGRSLGRHPGTAVAGFAEAVLRRAGVDPGRVRQRELQPNLMGDAARSHNIDALYAMDPVATNLVREGACDVLLANPLGSIVEPPIPIAGTAVSKRLLTRNPDAAHAIIRALDQAIGYVRQRQNDREVAAIIARYTRITADEALQMNRSEYWTSREISRSRVQSLAERFRTLGISEAPVATQNMILAAPRGQ